MRRKKTAEREYQNSIGCVLCKVCTQEEERTKREKGRQQVLKTREAFLIDKRAPLRAELRYLSIKLQALSVLAQMFRVPT